MLKLTHDKPWYSTAPIVSNFYYFFKTPSITNEEVIAQCQASQAKTDALLNDLDVTLAKADKSQAATEKSLAASEATLKRHAQWRIKFAEMEAQLKDGAPEKEANSTLPTSTPAPGV